LKRFLERYTKEQVRKASGIKAIFFDVDGVLTDGRIIYDTTGNESKQFNVKDGLIMNYLKKYKILTGAISGRESSVVTKRMAELKADFCHQGIVDKLSVFVKLVRHYKLKMKEVVFIGDDLNDVAVLNKCGFSVCPADSPLYIREQVDLVTKVNGGEGVLREVADLVLAAKGQLNKILKD
jgi:3-deoxy-D-manno-octulosonate 8-phosphate phosphatase (KDO 8-P phosphatase)